MHPTYPWLFLRTPPYLLNISARHVIDRKTMMAQIQRIHRVVCPVAAQLVLLRSLFRTPSLRDEFLDRTTKVLIPTSGSVS